MSLSDVEYSRMRPQPVQVRLQVCSGSSCKTIANFGVLRSLCLMMWLAIFFVSANGKRIIYFIGSQLGGGCRKGAGRIGRRRIRLQQMSRPRQKKVQRRNALAGVDAAATRAGQREHRQHCQQTEIPVQSHLFQYKSPRRDGNF